MSRAFALLVPISWSQLKYNLCFGLRYVPFRKAHQGLLSWLEGMETGEHFGRSRNGLEHFARINSFCFPFIWVCLASVYCCRPFRCLKKEPSACISYPWKNSLLLFCLFVLNFSLLSLQRGSDCFVLLALSDQGWYSFLLFYTSMYSWKCWL